MELSAQFIPPTEVQADWLVVGVWEDDPVIPVRFGAELAGTLERLRLAGDVTGKANELVPLLDRPYGAPRTLIVGLGKRDGADFGQLRDAAATAARTVTGKPLKRLALLLPEPVHSLSWETVAQAAGVGLAQGCAGPGLRKNKPERFAPEELWLLAPASAPDVEVLQGTRRADVEGRAVALARELVNTPPCDLYPESFAERASQVAGAAGVEVAARDEKWLEAERMNALLAVARGSDRPPRLV